MAVGAGFDPVGVVPALGFEVLMEPFELDAFLLDVAFGARFLDGFPMPDFDFVSVFANLMAFGARVGDVFKLMLIEPFPSTYLDNSSLLVSFLSFLRARKSGVHDHQSVGYN